MATEGLVTAATAATELVDEDRRDVDAADRRRRGRRPRLRRAVLAAHRAPRARVRRVLRAAAASRRGRGGPPAAPEGADPVRRPGVRVRRRRAAAGPRAARARHPGAGHLLRDAAHRAASSAARVEGAEIGEFGRSELTVRSQGGCSPGRRRRRGAGCRTATRSSARRRGSTRSRRRRARRSRRSSTTSGAIYGIQFHPEVVHTPYGQTILTTFLRDICGCDMTLERRRRSSRSRSPASAPRSGREGHLRPVGRRGLQRGGGARPPRGGGPADLRVRRPRAHAQERGRAGHLRVPRPVRHPARGASTRRTAS